jgi:hypothetical protein
MELRVLSLYKTLFFATIKSILYCNTCAILQLNISIVILYYIYFIYVIVHTKVIPLLLQTCICVVSAKVDRKNRNKSNSNIGFMYKSFYNVFIPLLVKWGYNIKYNKICMLKISDKQKCNFKTFYFE